MSQEMWTAPVQQPPRRGRAWLRVLLIGLGLFVATTIVMFLSGNLNLYPTVILIGNFLVPIVFVAFLYDHQDFSALSLDTVATSFCVGGILGVLGASILESLLLPTPSNPTQGLSLQGAMAVGLIEEGCKIFTALVLSHGVIAASLVETVIRGLLSPFGHGAWTGILGAVLFRQSGPEHFRINGPVILTYLFVSLLHGFWDGLPNTFYIIIPPGFPFSVTWLIVAVVGIVTLSVLYRQAMVQHMQQLQSTLPPSRIPM